jgi:hypothetical protein
MFEVTHLSKTFRNKTRRKTHSENFRTQNFAYLNSNRKFTRPDIQAHRTFKVNKFRGRWRFT